MNEKFTLIIALLFAVTSVVSAAVEEEDLHTLAICFLVLCVIILIIVIVVPILLYRRRAGYIKRKKISIYNPSIREKKFSGVNDKDSVAVNWIYTDPQPANTIYLPLDKRNQENGSYAHLEGSKKPDDPHTYEDLKKDNTFSGPAYDNPVATDMNEGDDHDYELADATIERPKGANYENPPHTVKNGDTAF